MSEEESLAEYVKYVELNAPELSEKEIEAFVKRSILLAKKKADGA